MPEENNQQLTKPDEQSYVANFTCGNCENDFKMNIKPCKICLEKRYGSTRFCRTHYFEHLKENREKREQILVERKSQKKLRHEQSVVGRKKLKKKAEELLHRLIRLEAVNKSTHKGYAVCYTCYAVKSFENLEAGHRYHGRLDLDPRNLKVQCAYCNHYLSGNLGEYERHLIQDYGLEWSLKLSRDASQDTGQYSYEFLKAKIEELKQKIKEYETNSN